MVFGIDFAIPVEGLTIEQLIFLMVIYGYIISSASNMMAEGAELLLSALGPAWAPIIGGLLIPALGALPDALMIFMSGMGSGTQKEIQEQLKIGAGTLVGSTVLLLTIPTSVGIFLSRRQLGGPEHRALKKDKIKTKKVLNMITGEMEDKEIVVSVPVLPKSFSLFDVGGTAISSTPKNAKVMMATALTYLFLQIPAFFWHGDSDGGAAHEKWFAFTGLIVALISFVVYLWWVANDDDALEIIVEKQREFVQKWHINNSMSNIARVLKETDPFIQSEQLFDLFDVNNNGSIDFEEMKEGWLKIGYDFDNDQALQAFNMLDSDHSGTIDRYEFNSWLEDFLLGQYILSQPVPTSLLPENSSITDIIAHVPFPKAVRSATAEKITKFLMNTNVDSKDPESATLMLTLGKEERFALHIWCSTIQHSYPFALRTHAEDLITEDDDTASIYSRATTTTAATGHTHSHKHRKQSNYIRNFYIEKLDKRTVEKVYQLRPKQQALVPGLPAWACASTPLIAFYKTTTSSADSFSTLFKSIANSNDMVTLEAVQQFAKSYDLALRPDQIKFLFYSHDTDRDHCLTAADFKLLLESLVDISEGAPVTVTSSAMKGSVNGAGESQPLLHSHHSYTDAEIDSLENDDDNDGDDEENDDHSKMTKMQMLRTALFLIIIGTIAVIAFSDPLVEVIGEMGVIMKLNPFYISFLVTPLASNASEFIASLKFAAKKTDVSLGLTLSSLYGAATMNNTICLSVFMGLIFFRGLSWDNTPETIAVIAVIYGVGFLGLKQTIPLWKAFLMLALFPLSLTSIYVMHQYLGM